MGKLFPIPEREPLSLHKAAFEDMAGYDTTAPSIREMFKYREEVLDTIQSVKPNEILLGASNPDFTDKVTIPWTGKSQRIAIFGMTGSGKTVLAKNIVADAWHKRFGLPLLIFDAKGDYSPAMHHAQTNPQLIARLKKYNLKPCAYHNKVLVPKFLGLKGISNAQEYTITLKDFKNVEDKSDQFEALMTFFELTQTANKPALRVMQRMAAETLPDDVGNWKKRIEEFIERKGVKSTQLLNLIDLKVGVGHIADRGGVDMPSALATEGMVTLRLSLRGSRESTINTYAALAASACIADRKKFLWTRGVEGTLNKPFAFLVDEAERYLGRNRSPSSTVLGNVYTEERLSGISICTVAQHPSQVAGKVLSESNHLLFSKLTMLEDRLALKARGFSDTEIEGIFQQLGADPRSPIKEWAVINTDNSIETFYPIPSLTNILSESYFQ